MIVTLRNNKTFAPKDEYVNPGELRRYDRVWVTMNKTQFIPIIEEEFIQLYESDVLNTEENTLAFDYRYPTNILLEDREELKEGDIIYLKRRITSVVSKNIKKYEDNMESLIPILAEQYFGKIATELLEGRGMRRFLTKFIKNYIRADFNKIFEFKVHRIFHYDNYTSNDIDEPKGSKNVGVCILKYTNNLKIQRNEYLGYFLPFTTVVRLPYKYFFNENEVKYLKELENYLEISSRIRNNVRKDITEKV